ncbi:MAG: YitT family protein [Clostridiales bacterium]|nr:YitT family protein [Clostridiales bacterium]
MSTETQQNENIKVAENAETSVQTESVEQIPQAEVAAAGASTADAPIVVGGKKGAKSKTKKEKVPLTREQKKKRIHNWLIVPIMILVASALRSICVRVFMTSPAFNFAPGGITGIGTMIEYKTGFSTGYTNIIINIPLVIIAFIFLSKPYAIKSAITVGVSSGGMILMQYLNFPQYGGAADPNAEPVLAAIACGVLGGIGVAILIRAGSSNGGTDIIAALIQRKYQAAGITWFIMGLDALVVLSSYFVYDNGLTPVFMSFTQQFCSAMVGDVILTGLKSAIKYEIITDEPEELSAELIAKLKHSVTKIDAMGMYAHSEKALLVCVIHKRQVTEFNNILKKYNNTFAYVTSTSEVFGKFI